MLHDKENVAAQGGFMAVWRNHQTQERAKRADQFPSQAT
jgi:hypothetical protein